MELAPTTNTKRCTKEIALLEEKFVCLVNDHSIEIFYDNNTMVSYQSSHFTYLK